MRLLKFDQDDNVSLTEDLLNEDVIPPYAILSHTWGEEEVTFDELKNACIQSLSYPEQEHRHNDIYRAVETCGWLLQDSNFNLWLRKQHGILWIKGDPGSGKSVLMKHAVRSTKIRFPKELVVPYFIHGQGSELQRTSMGVYRALLNSLLSHFPVCLAKLVTIFEDRESRFGGYNTGRWSWSSNELQEFLTDLLINHTQQHQVTIFVDALDECGEGPAREMMAYFDTLTKQAGPREARVRICLSSRYYPILGIDDLPSISVEERNHKDIKWFVNDRLRTFGSSPTRQKVLEEIMSKAQGGFQWALLVTELIIDRKLSGRRVVGQVASCPSTLSDLYASLLNDGTEMEKRQAIKLFRWIIFARRPMSAQELREALFTDHNMSYTSVTELRNHEQWSETMEDFQRYVTYISKGLVKFEAREFWEQWEESGHEAQLIHQSVADFLVKDFLTDEGMNSACAGHYLISRSCLKYLTLRDIPGRCPQQRDRMSSEFPLAPYAVRYVFDHIRSVEEAGLVQSDLLSALKWSPWSESMSQLIIVWKILNPNGLGTPSGWPFVRSSELHVLAALGSQSAFLLSLQKDPGALHRRDLDGNTPLHIAITEGHTDLANLLVDWHSKTKEPDYTRDRSCERPISSPQNVVLLDLDATNDEGETVLDTAVTMMATTTVLNLLDNGASAQRVRDPNLLLLFAIHSEDVALIRMLVTKRADLAGAIYYAVDHDIPHEIFIELLKAGGSQEDLYTHKDLEGDAPDLHHGGHALHLACHLGLTQKVGLLSEHGASATVLDQNGLCPLHVVVLNGSGSYKIFPNEQIRTVELLLRGTPTAVEITDRDGFTALEHAFQLERLDLIEVLLRDGRFSSPK
ncbi:hypothetical protein E8E13_002695 [Curvularia kusanoi]|uniref:Nephrocystin 3-like N-terminal domain-containing protein n=1 Tax=Curvularia kusanoi TaxID=90978 RepID=A0A9P4W5N4_CURKU|nr:hypothetical protein E8E13_002695 [Curvularia kusanoi]